MIAISTSTYHLSMARRLNSWYTLKDGDFTNPQIWISNGTRKHSLPQYGDNVVINHVVNFNTNATLQNLTINCKMLGDSTGKTLNITGDLNSPGVIDLTGSNIVINLYGHNNFLVDFTAGSSTINYAGNMTQPVLPFQYHNLSISGAGVKITSGDLIVTNSTNFTSSTLDLSSYNATLGMIVGEEGTLSKTSPTGLTKISGMSSPGTISNWLFSGNGDVEIWGGIFQFNPASPAQAVMGGGTYTFKANTTINAYGIGMSFNGPVIVDTGITVTSMVGDYNSGGVKILDSLNGVSSSSKWVGSLAMFVNNEPMTTGDIDVSNGFFWYNFDGDSTLWYTTYKKLAIGGSGLKTVAGDTRAVNGLVLDGTTTLELSSYNNTFGLVTYSTNTATLSKNSLIGLTTIGGISGGGIWNFAGNGDVIINGNVQMNPSSKDYFVSGTGTYTFNATCNFSPNGVAGAWNFDGPVLISGSVRVTIIYVGSLAPILSFKAGINGNAPDSILDNQGVVTISSTSAPMSTGKLYCNQATNILIYDSSGNQDIAIPSDPINPGYYNLQLSGSGTIKRLLGNVSVKNIYTLDSGVTLDGNGYSLTNP